MIRSGGFTYTEVLVTVALLALVLVPALDSLSASLNASSSYASRVENQYRLIGRMEETLADSFVDLADAAAAAGGPGVPTAYSDAPGSPERLLVFISAYDADNADADDDPFTGTDPDLLWVRVEIENSDHRLDTLSGPS